MLDLALPHLCIACGVEAEAGSNPALCEVCSDIGWKVPRCRRCGRRCHSSEASARRCHRCLKVALPYTRLQTLGPYRDWLGRAIVAVKYREDGLAARFLIKSAAAFDVHFIPGRVATVVSSHPRRLRQRGVRRQHMPGLIGPVCARAGVPLLELLRKVSFEVPQVELSGHERRRAVEGTLEYIGPEVPPREVILFDDVWTTGSTVREAVRVLRGAGVKKVQVMCFAMSESSRL